MSIHLTQKLKNNEKIMNKLLEQLSTKSVLIVSKSQSAIVFMKNNEKINFWQIKVRGLKQKINE